MDRTIGIWGLGAMGRSLALQALDKGLGIATHDPWAEAREAWPGPDPAEASAARFAERLARPRRILLLVKAGAPTDAAIDALLPYLEPGDLVADLGNSHFRDTEARQARLAKAGIALIGIGISGGAEGARTGASFMAGGDRAAWERLRPAIETLAARADGSPTAGWFGPGGAGHFVKTVHNGIEYAEMQALAEAWQALRDGCGLAPREAADRFAAWNEGLGRSFLTGLAAQVLRAEDADGAPLIGRVLDQAGQKGTGRWTVEAALELGIPVPTLAEALFARALSARVEARRAVARLLAGPRGAMADGDIGPALLAARICAFAQGFALLGAASSAYEWDMDLAAVARVWSAGCILRGALLDEVARACEAGPAPDLIAAPPLAGHLAAAQRPWREAVAACQAAGIPVPVMASSLAYYDGWRSGRLGADLIAAQRDAFGAHGFRRTDREGSFTADWGTGVP